MKLITLKHKLILLVIVVCIGLILRITTNKLFHSGSQVNGGSEIYFFMPIEENEIAGMYGDSKKLPPGSEYAGCSSFSSTTCYYWILLKSEKESQDSLEKLQIAFEELLYFEQKNPNNTTFKSFATASDNSCRFSKTESERNKNCKLDFRIIEYEGKIIINFSKKPFFCYEKSDYDWKGQLEKTASLYFDKFELQINGEAMNDTNMCCWCGG